MTYLDEVTNDRLMESLPSFSTDEIVTELDRVGRLVESRSMTGDDLTYWFTRERLIRSYRIRSGH